MNKYIFYSCILACNVEVEAVSIKQAWFLIMSEIKGRVGYYDKDLDYSAIKRQ